MQKYIEQINKLENPTFQKIRTLADKSISHLPKEERDRLWEELNHGVNLLDSHELMCQYLYSFGNMHEAKILIALKGFNQACFEGEIDIIDWGCGEGLATISFFDYLKMHKLNASVKNIILIEPSQMALERAKLHVSTYQKDSSNIKIVAKYLDDVTNKDIETDGFRPVIHFFSNILDIKEIDFLTLSNRLKQSVLNDNYVISVGPINAGNRRIDAFYDYFKVPIIFEINEFRFDYGGSATCTFKAKVYKLEYNEEGNLIPIEYYPSVQFHASSELDCIKQKRNQLTPFEKEKLNKVIDSLTRFETSTPFDIGASVYDDVHPVLAVLNNIVTRGLPTKTSPFVETIFNESFGYSVRQEERGEVSFKLTKEVEYQKILSWVSTSINSNDKPDYSGINTTQLQLIISPIAISRIQKTILEAVMTGKLDISLENWKILVEEHDVPCAAIAFKDLEQMFNHLTQLSSDYQSMKFPTISLEIITPPEFLSSPLHLGAKKTSKSLPIQSKSEYDLVIDIAVLLPTKIDKNSFSHFNCKNHCYFNIRSSIEKRSERTIYTSNKIHYRELVFKGLQGKYTEIEETKELLKYFMQLMFRKEDFRAGQLPILNRALQNKAVIGLLPTGGGKSLTYQLAAMLQPGVTLVVDPLSSLMKDQYDGLINAGMDCCTYINTTDSPERKKIKETQMESSQMLFVFLSPERLAIYNFRERLKNMHELNVYFSYGVIDEVHCVSEWGHDFRIPYLHLGRNLYKYVRAKEGPISLFGLTATASFDVLADVERELSAEGAFDLDADTIVRYENTNRLELQYKIEKVNVEFEADSYNYDIRNELDPILSKPINLFSYYNSVAFQKSKNRFLTNVILQIPNFINELQTKESIDRIKNTFLERQDSGEVVRADLKVEMPDNFYEKKNHYEQAGIVFCQHKANTGNSVDKNYQTLKETINDVGTYTGGNDNENIFNKNLELFRDNKQSIMVATKAFGMGIDKPNVRFTINMNYSSSLESFVQEAGRAGRDRKIALSTILLSYYNLSRINSECKSITFPIPIIKNRWYHSFDMQAIINRYNLKIDDEYIDTCTPEHDLLQFNCEKKNVENEYMFSKNLCLLDCKDSGKCNLKNTPKDKRNYWFTKKEFVTYLADKNLAIDKKFIRYQNADYESVMYFYNGSFKGENVENDSMIALLNITPVRTFYGNDAERKPQNDAKGFLSPLLNSEEGNEVVSLINYEDKRNDEGNNDIAKAIYRMSCIGLIEDFTQDYTRKEYRIVAKKKKEGDYFNGLKQFLLRYFIEDRVEQEIIKAKNFQLKIESDNALRDEIYRCLAYLTTFIYEKISIKRKRAIDQMRNFCIQGIDETKDWKVRNEELKEFIYYYFNSKYAQEDYVADNGEPYSLTVDTNEGKFSDSTVLFKYLKVIEDEIVGVGLPIDNVKHLQGAVRLLSRSLIDSNPCLSLLNSFCLFFLGTKDNQNLKNELEVSYKEGMQEFESRMNNPVEFWNLFEKYNTAISSFADKQHLTHLKKEVMMSIHGNKLKNITNLYLK